MEQDQESANIASCFHAFRLAHPKKHLINAEMCDGGSMSCPECPWKDTAENHSNNKKGK